MPKYVELAPSQLFISFAQTIWPIYINIVFGDIHIKVTDRVHQVFGQLKDKATIICPNHPALTDPEIIFALSAIVGEHFNFLTARELFGQNESWRSKWFQSLGCYSVERGIADLHAFRTTKKLLEENKKVVIFPEGEISYQNNVLAHLENGPEFIALYTLSELQKKLPNESIYLLPIAISYRYREDIREELELILQKIEHKLKIKNCNQYPVHERIINCFDRLLTKLEVLYKCKFSNKQNLDDRIFNIRDAIIHEVQLFLEIELPDTLSQLCKLHILRGNLFHQQINKNSSKLNNIKSKSKSTLKEIRQYYKQILFATGLLAIGEHSFKKNMTQEEAAELLNLLARQVLHKPLKRLSIDVLIDAEEAIDTKKYLEEYSTNRDKAIDNLKITLANQLTKLLTDIQSYSKPFYVD